MLDSLINHPHAPLTAASGSMVAQAVLPPPHDVLTTAMQIITFLVGVLPSIIKIFKKSKPVDNEKNVQPVGSSD